MYLDNLHLFVCPLCKGELNWKITEVKRKMVLVGEAQCKTCRNLYPVKDGIALFLNPKIQDIRIWERAERNSRKKAEYEYKENSGNLFCLLKQIGKMEHEDIKKTAEYYEKYFIEQGMQDTIHSIFKIIDFCITLLPQKDEVILDIASGKGLLAREIILRTENEVIVSDINPLILMKNRKCNQMQDNEKVSYVAFDINASPFRNGEINIITTLFGMQNIGKIDNAIMEIRRICSGKFISLSSFLEDVDIANKDNLAYLRQNNCESAWIKELFTQMIQKYGFQSRELYTSREYAQAVKKEDLESRFAVMKFPIKDTYIEHNISEYY